MIKAKRFWKDVDIVEHADGYGLELDGRPLKTPNKGDLVLSSYAMAELLKSEWASVEGEINPDQMPMTRFANSSVEKIAKNRNKIHAFLAEYITTELICYRAAEPMELVNNLDEWDEWLDWARGQGYDLNVTNGLMPIDQPTQNQERALKWLNTLDDFALMAAHEAITITGSFVLGQALIQSELDAGHAYRLSRIEEDYQAEKWGADDDALAASAERLRALENAVIFLRASQKHKT